MLKIETPNGFLKLGAGCEIPMTITNPMLTDRGSYSLPFTAPLKPNSNLLGNIDIKSKTILTDLIDVKIEHGFLKEKGAFKITDLDKNTIESSLTTREGAFWEWAKTIRLRDMTLPADKAFRWYEDLDDYTSHIWPDVEMAFFPIAINKKESLTLDNLPEDVMFYITNEFRQTNYQILNDTYNLAIQERSRGTNITGFLYILEVLIWVFNNYGLRFNVNDLEGIEEMKRCVVLNSAAEPFRDDLIRYKELLPTSTVMEFINSIEYSFCCRFFVDLRKKTVDLRLFKNILILDPINIKGSLHLLKSETKQVVLINSPVSSDNTTVSKSLTEAQIISSNLFEEMSTDPLESDKIYLTINEDPIPAHIRVICPEKIVFNTPTQCYFSLFWEKNDENKWEYKCKVFHSRYYNYQGNSKSESKEIDPGSKFVPMVYTKTRQFFDDDIEGEYKPGYFIHNCLMPHYAVEKTAYYKNDLLDSVYDWDVEMPISFAFYRGKLDIPFPTHHFIYGPLLDWIETEDPLPNFHDLLSYNIPWGSTDIYTSSGLKLSGNLESQPELSEANIALRWVGENGLYEHFFKELEQFYLLSGKEIAIKNIDINEIIDKGLFNRFCINGVYFFFKEIKLTLTLNSIKFDSATGITTKPYV